MTLSVVLINDDRRVNGILSAVLRAWEKHDVQVEMTDFNFRGIGTMREAKERADIFVVGLERQSPWGRYAEGVVVALELFRSGKKVLLVSGEDHAVRLNLWFYWDLAARGFLLDAMTACLERPIPGDQERELLKVYFRGRLQMPSSH